MKTTLQKNVMNEILSVTAKIQKEFPALYRLLDETPLFITHQDKEVNGVDFEHYLDSLKKQLAAFENAASHQKTGE